VFVGTSSTSLATSSTSVSISSTATEAAAEPERVTPAEVPEADEVEAEPLSDSVNVLHVTYVDANRGRTVPVTVYYPTAPGTFPLVVFAHGYAASAATYELLEQDVATAGFVVAAPDFPLSSSAVTGNPTRDPVAQAADVSFVVDSILDAGTRPAPLADTIASTAIGVIGHSDGGITAAGVAYNSEYADARVGAAVILSGAAALFPGAWFTSASPPLLAIHGDADGMNPYWSSEALFAGATGPKWLVTVVGGSHGGPFTTDPSETSVAVLVADFLRAQLLGDAEAESRLASDAETGSLTLAARA
jgi:fermentation-respiration switch protein FrsA (DUF1100 family)